MAENKYVNANAEAGDLVQASKNCGADCLASAMTFEVAAADADGSIYRIAKAVPCNLVPIQIEINADAITAGTDYDLGLYKTDGNGGAVVDADLLADGIDMSSGFALGSEASGLSNVAIANIGKKLFELAGATEATKEPTYDIAFTANTVGSAAGTISVRLLFARG